MGTILGRAHPEASEALNQKPGEHSTESPLRSGEHSRSPEFALTVSGCGVQLQRNAHRSRGQPATLGRAWGEHAGGLRHRARASQSPVAHAPCTAN